MGFSKGTDLDQSIHPLRASQASITFLSRLP
jgi:hypothetical protein